MKTVLPAVIVVKIFFDPGAVAAREPVPHPPGHPIHDDHPAAVQPEPAETGFTFIGGDVWEATIQANGSSDYPFYSSPNLPFSPGNLVTKLTQVNPPGDKGTVSEGNLLTTDAIGTGKARMILTGNPTEFIRATTVPCAMINTIQMKPGYCSKCVSRQLD